VDKLALSGQENQVIIDCDSCRMQETGACDECIVPVLLHQMSGPFELAPDEATALENLSGAGMVAPLRLVRTDEDSNRRTVAQ
jgi:hypothetical protein